MIVSQSQHSQLCYHKKKKKKTLLLLQKLKFYLRWMLQMFLKTLKLLGNWLHLCIQQFRTLLLINRKLEHFSNRMRVLDAPLHKEKVIISRSQIPVAYLGPNLHLLPKQRKLLIENVNFNEFCYMKNLLLLPLICRVKNI